MENLTQKWTQSRHFSQNQGTFFDFQNTAGEASPQKISKRKTVTNQIEIYAIEKNLWR